MLTYRMAEAAQNLPELIKYLNQENRAIKIVNTECNDEAILISKRYWIAIQETLYLQNTGVLDRIRNHESEKVEEIGNINWNSLKNN